MKKKTVIIAAALIVFALLAGLFINSQYKKRQQEAIAAGQSAVIISHDKTVLPDFIYNIDSISLESIVGEKHYSFDFSEQDSLEDVEKLSSHIVQGRISNLSFTFINGRAWTMAELQILQSYKGGLDAEDVISVYYPGGYVSLSDYNAHYDKGKPGSDNEFYQSFADGAPIPYLMEEGIFCLTDQVQSYSLMDGAYVLSCGNSSLLSFTDESSLQWLGENIDLNFLTELINKENRN